MTSSRAAQAFLVAVLLAIATGCSSTAVGSEDPPEVKQEKSLRAAGCTSEVCVRAGSAGCWEQQPLISACRSCERTYRDSWAASVWTGCKAEFDAYAACLRTSDFRCDEAGVATPASCDAEKLAAEQCLAGPDAGSTE
ncbi:MAG: hypothetical protein JWP87_1005 [Labilithrix sp.]|nr:hypothetical protein [Labilithrix sp.]